MTWEFASATTIGSHHRAELAPHNGQDALYYHYDPEQETGLAVVADGCGSSPYSEVGAHLGVRLLAEIWHNNQMKAPGYNKRWPWDHFVIPAQAELLEDMICPLVERLRAVLCSLGEVTAADRLRDAVTNYGLFTLNGVVFDHYGAVFFCIGDGVTIINGDATEIKPPEQPDPENEGRVLTNAPRYLGYSVLDPAVPVEMRFYRVLPTRELSSFVVASDGLGPLLDCADTLLPGERRMVGPIDQLWEVDANFTEDSPRLQRWLNLAARTKKKLRRGPDGSLPELDTFPGLLDDDTTFIVGRQIHTGSKED